MCSFWAKFSDMPYLNIRFVLDRGISRFAKFLENENSLNFFYDFQYYNPLDKK